MSKSLSFYNVDKDTREASLGNHHYNLSGNYYHGYDVFYAYGEIKPPNGEQWKEVNSGNGSLGKAERSARHHFRTVRKQ